MLEELAKLVIEYSHEQKNIDDSFIKKVIIIANKYYLLNDYINDVVVFKKYWNASASYGLDNKFIIANIHSINKSIEKLENEFPCLKKTQLFKYLYCVQILFHEIEHVKQQRIVEKIDDIESEILRAEFMPFYKAKDATIIKRFFEYRKQTKLYHQFYIFSPSERLAQINSFETITEVCGLLDDEISYNLMKYYKFENLLKGYNIGLINYLANIPTKFYLQKTNPNYDYGKVEKMSVGLDPESLIKFGLYSSSEELYKISQKSTKLVLKLERSII